jgi:hypothetical protein
MKELIITIREFERSADGSIVPALQAPCFIAEANSQGNFVILKKDIEEYLKLVEPV